jgi:hypothetical protein
MRNRSGVFAAILLASCKDLFPIICIYFARISTTHLVVNFIDCRPLKRAL